MESKALVIINGTRNGFLLLCSHAMLQLWSKGPTLHVDIVQVLSTMLYLGKYCEILSALYNMICHHVAPRSSRILHPVHVIQSLLASRLVLLLKIESFVHAIERNFIPAS